MKKKNKNWHSHDKSASSLLFRMKQGNLKSFIKNEKLVDRLMYFGLIEKGGSVDGFGDYYVLTRKARTLLFVRGL